MLKYIYKFFKPLSPEDYLIRQVSLENLVNDLLEEEKKIFENFVEEKKLMERKEEIKKKIESERWKKFLDKLKANDELWFFRFPDKYWKKLQGRQGYVILRKQKVIEEIITFMN